VLGEELAGLVRRYYGVIKSGNFEHGASILWERAGLEAFAKAQGDDYAVLAEHLQTARELLFNAREKRQRPLRDDKVLTSWNGLMIAALAMGGRILNEPKYLQAAQRAADFILDRMYTGGKLLRRFRNGQVKGQGFLDDHAFFTWGLIELYEADPDPERLELASELMELTLQNFWDQLHKGFYFTAHDAEALLIKEKDIYDGALPSGNSVSALNLIRLSRLTGKPDWEVMAWQLMKHFSAQVSQHPMAYTQFLIALDLALKGQTARDGVE
jgi:uncharacterized protein YyaL (SSP411 family)